MTRAALLALLLCLVATATARAELVRPAGEPSGEAPAPDWVAVAERIALEYAARAGWSDACAGRAVRVDVYRDLDSVHGRPIVAYADLGGACSMAVEAAQLDTPEVFCDTYVHERLHLVRGDGWHDPDPAQPLYVDVLPVAACEAAWRAELTRAEAVASVRARLGGGWRVRVVGRPFGQGAEAAFLVRATRRGHGRRTRRVEYEVWRERSGAPVGLLRVY